MNAVWARGGLKQSELWRQLGVVRSAVCEMLDVLAALGLLSRDRDERDRRTWVVRLTARGREVFERAHEELVNSGDVALQVDAVLAHNVVEIDLLQRRFDWVGWSLSIAVAFGSRSTGPDLYWWDLEDFYTWFADPDGRDPDDGVPFVRAN